MNKNQATATIASVLIMFGGTATYAMAQEADQSEPIEEQGAAVVEEAAVETLDVSEDPSSPLPAETAPAVVDDTALTETVATKPKPECELHVFPSLEGEAQTTGWLSGFGIVGAIADAAANDGKNKSEGDYLRDALGPQMQVQSLKSIDLLAEMNLPEAQIIFEEPIADRKISTKQKTRLTDSTATCYVEFLVTQNFYRKAAIYGRSLNNRFIYKDFRNGLEETKLVKGRGGNGLKHFPPKTPEESEAAEADLQQAFVANFKEFAKKLQARKRR